MQQAIIMHMNEFLKAVDSGKTGFRTASASVRDLTAFQSIAKVAQEAYDLGYIGFFKPHRESYSAHRFCDAVLVSNITGAGRQYLNAL